MFAHNYDIIFKLFEDVTKPLRTIHNFFKSIPPNVYLKETREIMITPKTTQGMVVGQKQ